MYVCVCHAVNEESVRKLARDSCFAFAAMCQVMKDNKSCCKCVPRIKELINEEKQQQKRDSGPRTSEVTISHADCIAGVLTQS